MADLSIIIVSYNNEKVITDCLNSIKNNNDIGDKLQVIVVEQSPQDSVYDSLKEAFPWIILLRNDNKGFGAGNNAGAAISDAPFLLFLNPDTVLLEPVCSFAVEKFRRDPDLGMFGVQLLDGDHRKSSSFMMKVPFGIKNKIAYKLCNAVGHFDSDKMYIQGADMFTRREAFEKAGGFDENLFMYCEETDLCTRISKANYKIVFDPSKHIVHLEGKSTSGGYCSALKNQIESFRYLCDKYSLPFYRIIRKEYQSQRLKMLVYGICGHKKTDLQKQIIETIKMFL